MRSKNKVTKYFLSATIMLSTIIMLTGQGRVFATTYAGTTIVTFSANPATLSGDSTIDVTITTTTTAAPGGESYIDDGKVTIELLTDGSGGPPYVPVPVGTPGAVWVSLNSPGQNPENGITTLDVDLDALGFDCETVGGFRAHYVTGGGGDKVGTHFSDGVELEAVCGVCEWIGETAWAAGTSYVEQGNWATYTEYVPDSTVTLYAGQTMEAGTVYFSDVDGNGDITITITLDSGWRFKDVAENVKIQDYASVPPAENPNPGSFAWKFEAESSPFTTTAITGNYYYGVHVDVEREVCE